MSLSKHSVFPGATQEEKIVRLREAARQYIEENNLLVEKKWACDLRIARAKDATDIPSLLAEQQAISQTIRNLDYGTKIKKLLDDIQALEIALYGQSNIGSDSPYTL